MCSHCRIVRAERIKYGIYLMHFCCDIFPNYKLVRTDSDSSLFRSLSLALFILLFFRISCVSPRLE